MRDMGPEIVIMKYPSQHLDLIKVENEELAKQRSTTKRLL